jgi:HCOMODA/2-hydroxy-3-carboxy-muconic semialdehyde decarboxylase
MRMVSRRAVVLGLAGGVLLAAARRSAAQAPAPVNAGPPDPAFVEDLVAADRILADQGVVDGYGHVSVRHNGSSERYLMSRSIAPEMVTAADIMEYDLDSRPVDPRGRVGYLERFIHGEIYRARPDVKAIVHDHSPSAIPFGVAGVPAPGPGHGPGRPGDVSRPGRGSARGSQRGRDHQPAVGPLEAQGAGTGQVR